MKFSIHVLDEKLPGKLQFREYQPLGIHTVQSNLTGLTSTFSSFVTDPGENLCSVSGLKALRQRTFVSFTQIGAR